MSYVYLRIPRGYHLAWTLQGDVEPQQMHQGAVWGLMSAVGGGPWQRGGFIKDDFHD